MLRIVFANLLRRKLRTLTSVVAIAFTSAVVIVAIASNQRFNDSVGSMLEGLNIRALDEGEMLPLSFADKLRRIPGVKEVEWHRGIPAATPDGKYGFWVSQQSPGFPTFYGGLVDQDEALWARWNTEKTGVMVDAKTLDVMGWKVDQTVTVKTGHGEVTGKVMGVLRGPLIANMWWHYEYFDEFITPAMGKNKVFWFATRCEPGGCPALAKAIDEALKGSEPPAWAQPISATFLGIIGSQVTTFNLLKNFSLFMVFMTAMITATTLAMSLRERRADFGVLRALGFGRGRVFGLVLLEACVLALVGAVIGTLPLVLRFHAGGLNLGPDFMSNISVGPLNLALAAALALPFGALIALWPAAGVVRIDVIHALGDG